MCVLGRGGVILISLLLTFDETMCLLRKRRENHPSDVKVDSVSCNFSVDKYLTVELFSSGITQSLILYSPRRWRRITWSYFSENWINIDTEHVCINPMATDVTCIAEPGMYGYYRSWQQWSTCQTSLYRDPTLSLPSLISWWGVGVWKHLKIERILNVKRSF